MYIYYIMYRKQNLSVWYVILRSQIVFIYHCFIIRRIINIKLEFSLSNMPMYYIMVFEILNKLYKYYLYYYIS